MSTQFRSSFPTPAVESLRQAVPARRRALALAGCGLGLGMAGVLGAWPVRATEVPGLAFAGFEVIDDQPDPARAAGLSARAAQVTAQMARGLDERGLYRVVDLGPAAAALARARAENEFLHRCNGCLAGVGQAAGVRLVGVGWVQRVSNLILNMNLAIWDVQDDRMTLTKSVDIRGDNEESWRRGVAYMLRDMVERRERQPRYGL